MFEFQMKDDEGKWRLACPSDPEDIEPDQWCRESVDLGMTEAARVLFGGQVYTEYPEDQNGPE